VLTTPRARRGTALLLTLPLLLSAAACSNDPESTASPSPATSSASPGSTPAASPSGSASASPSGSASTASGGPSGAMLKEALLDTEDLPAGYTVVQREGLDSATSLDESDNVLAFASDNKQCEPFVAALNLIDSQNAATATANGLYPTADNKAVVFQVLAAFPAGEAQRKLDEVREAAPTCTSFSDIVEETGAKQVYTVTTRKAPDLGDSSWAGAFAAANGAPTNLAFVRRGDTLLLIAHTDTRPAGPQNAVTDDLAERAAKRLDRVL
jgi:hypothetical protein